MTDFRLCDAGIKYAPHNEWNRTLGHAGMDDVGEDIKDVDVE